MAMTLEELQVVIDAKIEPYKRKMKELEAKTKQASNAVEKQTSDLTKRIGGKMNGIAGMLGRFASLAVFAYIGKKLLDIGMYGTQMALEVTAAMNQIKRQMGESSQSFLKWAQNNANAMNMSTGEAVKYGAVYSNLFSSFIKDGEKLSAYTAKMLQTSAVVAEGTGRSITDVMERIRSGLLGNTEAIEDLGINVNVAMIESTEAFKRFANGQSWNQLDFRTQQQIRLMAILEQATAKYGNTLANSVNGRISLFKSLLKDSALNVGNAMLPVINAMMPVLNSLAMVLKNVTAKLAEFVALMFNKKATSKAGSAAGGIQDVQKAAEGAGDALGDLGDAGKGLGDATGGAADNLDDTAKSAKKAVKELMGLAGFDEITTLNINKDDGDGGGGSGGSPGGGGGGKGKGGSGSPADILPTVELTNMDNQFKSIFDGWLPKLKELADLFGKGFNAAFRADGIDRLMAALGRIQKVVGEIFSDPRVTNAFGQMLEKWAYALGQFTGSIATVALGIGIFIAESIANGLVRQKEHIKTALSTWFTNLGNIGQSAGNIAQSLSNTFYEVMTSSGAIRIGSAIVSAFLAAGTTIIEIGSNIAADFVRGAEETIRTFLPGWEKVFSASLDKVAPIFETIEQAVEETGTTLKNVYDTYIKPFISDFWSGVDKIGASFVKAWEEHINPVLDRIAEKFGPLYEEHIKPAIDEASEAFGKLAEAIGKLWNEVLAPFVGWLIGGTLAEGTAVFETAFGVAVEIVKTFAGIVENLSLALQGLIDFLTGVFTGDWEKAWNGVKDLFVGIVGAILANLGIDINKLIAEFQRWWNSVVAIYTPVGQWFTSKFKEGWTGLTNIFKSLGSWFQSRWSELTSNLSNIPTWFQEKFQSAWNFLTNIFKPFSSWFGERWSETKSKLAEINSWFTTKFQDAWTGLTNIFQKLGGWFGEQWGKVKSVLGEVGSWFTGKFNEAYEGVKKAFSGIVEFFSGIWSKIKSTFTHVGTMVGEAIGGAVRSVINGVLNTVEGTINRGISVLNSAVSVINKLPGVSIGGFSPVNLPRLARGGIVDSPTIAMIGEAGKEVVMPLENTGFLQTMGRVVGGAVLSAIGGADFNTGGFSGNGDIVINIAGHEFGRVAIREINRAQEEAGQLLLNI